MSLIIGKPIDEDGFIDINFLKFKYPAFCNDTSELSIFINEVFNLETEIIHQPRKNIELPIVKKEIGQEVNYYICLTELMEEYGIPVHYYIHIVVIHFISYSGEKKKIIPIFPNEIITDSDTVIDKLIRSDIESLKKIADSYQIISKMYEMNYAIIAEDLKKGLIRIDKGDIEGSIKFFRKVLEGLENEIDEDLFGSKNRLKALKNLLKKGFHLLSNFGEHSGTEGHLYEAILSKEISISLAKYIVSKNDNKGDI